MRVLVTRPQPEAERTAAALQARGHAAVLSPLIRIEPVEAIELGANEWAAVAVTSANAIGAIGAHPQFAALRRLPLFAVGERSAEAARSAGFAQVRSADGDVAALATLVRSECQAGPVLYLAGAERAGDLPAALASAGLPVATAVVYRAATIAGLSEAAHAAFQAGGIDGVLHYSQRSAEAFTAAIETEELLPAARAAAHFCLSQQVAQPLRRAGLPRIRIAPEPNETALLALLDG